jgi:hypothetical protein
VNTAYEPAAVHTPTPVGAAEAAAEALRLLNHLTLAAPAAGVPGCEDVGDVNRVVGELRVVADRLPQVCDQVVSSLQRLGDRRPWHVDDGTTEHPDEVVSTAVEHLQVASCIAEDFGCNVQLAHCAVAHLYQ